MEPRAALDRLRDNGVIRDNCSQARGADQSQEQPGLVHYKNH